jgi:hypothetical protein
MAAAGSGMLQELQLWETARVRGRSFPPGRPYGFVRRRTVSSERDFRERAKAFSAKLQFLQHSRVFGDDASEAIFSEEATMQFLSCQKTADH